MRLGIYGGRFDPPHLGHLLLAERAREDLSLDEVRFVPAKAPPHKRARAPAAARLAMVRLATGGNPAFTVSDIELERAGASYSFDTVVAVAAERPDAELFFLTGADAYADIATWHRARELVTRVRMVVLPRPGASLAGLEPFFSQHALRLDAPRIEISSTDLRARFAEDRSVRYLTPDPVAAYAREHGLYTAPSPKESL